MQLVPGSCLFMAIDQLRDGRGVLTLQSDVRSHGSSRQPQQKQCGQLLHLMHKTATAGRTVNCLRLFAYSSMGAVYVWLFWAGRETSP